MTDGPIHPNSQAVGQLADEARRAALLTRFQAFFEQVREAQEALAHEPWNPTPPPGTPAR